MSRLHFKLGTRGSPLAMWQAERVSALLMEKCPDIRIEVVIIHTLGDKVLDRPLVQLGDKGLFTREIETALQKQEIDFAVHSFKDLPTVLPQGLGIVSIPERDSPFDALFSHKATSLRALPENPTIATGSLRRRAQILALRPDAKVVDLRGNVNTRVEKFLKSNWDGMIMAHAGIRRMNWEDRMAGVLAPEEMLPAPAQGALAIEARVDDGETVSLLREIHDEEAAWAVTAERAFLATLEGGCQVPMGAYAHLNNGTLHLEGLVASIDGKRLIRQSISGDRKAETLGKSLAEQVYQQAAGRLLRN